jgi:cbb3-type cytochrome oxidase subunit 3
MYLTQGTTTRGPTLPDVSTLPVNVGFSIPSLDMVLTFILRFFFIIAGLAALIYLLLGALAWITSGGNKENVDKAQQKIQAAVIGLIVIFAVLALVALLENVLSLGLGVTQPIKFPKLIDTTPTP